MTNSLKSTAVPWLRVLFIYRHLWLQTVSIWLPYSDYTPWNGVNQFDDRPLQTNSRTAITSLITTRLKSTLLLRLQSLNSYSPNIFCVMRDDFNSTTVLWLRDWLRIPAIRLPYCDYNFWIGALVNLIVWWQTLQIRLLYRDYEFDYEPIQIDCRTVITIFK